MKSLWSWAAVVCAVASVIASIALGISFRSGGKFHPDIDWNAVNKMAYQDAAAYLMEHTIFLSPWEAFQQAVIFPQFWFELGELALMLFLFSFSCCGIVLLMAKRQIAA